MYKCSLGEKGKHGGFKIRSLFKVTGSNPVASTFMFFQNIYKIKTYAFS